MSTRNIRLTATSTLAALAATLAAIGTPVPTSAANFTVDTLSDNAADGLTLREAIAAANATPGPDRVTFADGLTGTITLTGGQLTSSGDLEIAGPGESLLTIDGGGASRVLQATAGTDLTLLDLTIANGSTLGSGGGVAASGVGRLDIERVTFFGNEASNQGGGLWVLNPMTDLIHIADVMFDNNRSGNPGGGLYVNDAAGSGEVRITGSSFIENVSVNGNGAGAFVTAPGRSVVVDDVGAVRNRATNGNGGGLWLDGGDVSVDGLDALDNQAGTSFGGATINSNTGDVDVHATVFSGNTAQDSGAGSISSAAEIRVSDAIVAENSAPGLAGLQLSSAGETRVDLATVRDNTGGTVGGLQVSAASSVHLGRSTIDGNQGTTIGGIAVIGANTIVDSTTVSNNASGGATGTGGGMYVTGGSIDVFNSTFAGNESREGGAIHGAGAVNVRLRQTTMADNLATSEGGGVHVGVGGDVDISDSIVADNSAPTFPDVNDTTLDISHSILGNGMGLILDPTESLIGVDPKLTPLADNGGPTSTMMPMLDSPAIDAGNDMLIIVPPFVDQRGRLRPASRPDMGSVEVFDDESQIWVPTTPARFVDTRSIGETIDDVDEKTGAFVAGEQRQITFAGRGDVPGDAVAVIANITAVTPVGNGYITAHPCVNPRPNAASLNYTGGVNLGNEIILGLSGGDACVYTSESVHLTIDVVGYISAESPYQPVIPARFLDTRPDGVTLDGVDQAGGIPGAGQVVEIDVAGRGSVAAAARSAVMYVTAVTPQGSGYVTVWDCASDRPLASSLNHVDGVNRGNEIVADLSDSGSVCFFTSADTHLTVDVVGFVEDGSNHESLLAPSRLLDTRSDGQTVDALFAGSGMLAAGGTVELDVSGRAGIPSIATTVTVNVTAVQPQAAGYVTVFDCGALPLASSLNYVPGTNGGNEIIASLNANGRVCLRTSQATHLTADVTGWTSL